ncbi:MAG: diaminopimelate epimerase [Chlorobi bacterium]|nr:diaminopimelate epimerase [Chlorobiota bacterium]
MMKIPFTKAQAALNDFVIVDDREGSIPVEARKAFAREACLRRKGIGGDGVIFIEKNNLVEFTMAFYNPDGTDGSMCGNGGRCAALFAYRKGIAGSEMGFEVMNQYYKALILDDGVRLFFPPPKTIRLNFKLRLRDKTVTAHYVHNGAPHVVVFIDDFESASYLSLDDIPVRSLGQEIRLHGDFRPVGVNANFVSIDTDQHVHIRTFEKGVEAETASCGTGAIAAAIVSHAVRNIEPPVTLHTFGGDCLTVGFRPLSEADRVEIIPFIESDIRSAGIGNDLYLEGPAHLVFEGVTCFDEEHLLLVWPEEDRGQVRSR